MKTASHPGSSAIGGRAMSGSDDLLDLSRRLRGARGAILAGQLESQSFISDDVDFAPGAPPDRDRIEAALQDCRDLSGVLAGVLHGYVQGRRRAVVGATGYGAAASMGQSLVNKSI